MADIHILHESASYRLLDFRCFCTTCSIAAPEYNDSFNLVFIRKGFFEYRSYRRNDEIHVGRVLISKPGYEHTTRHINDQADVLTILEFKKEFFTGAILEQFGNKLPWILKNNDIHSLMVNITPGLEYHHQRILQKIATKNYNSLEIDEAVIGILEKILGLLGAVTTPENIPDQLKQYHLGKIEMARDYILTHFKEMIPIDQLASHCLISPFHFSRLFKMFIKTSPHQYLTAVRLTHAKVLLTETHAPVADIAYECGFNSPEHFVTAFKQHFHIKPSALRQEHV